MLSEISTIVAQIRDWQCNRGLSDTELCRRFTGLGSTKTYTRVQRGDFSEIEPERWLRDYQSVWQLMQIEDQASPIDEPVYDDLDHMTASRLAVTDAFSERGNNRLVIIEGPSGSGKTTAGMAIAARFGRKIVCAEADETWKDSPANMLAGLLRAIGVTQVPCTADARKTTLLDHLRATPLCILIDEAHHLGPRTLNLVKTILNQTKCQIVFLAIGRLFRMLESSNYEEARQLTKNRLCERVKLGSPSGKDIKFFLSRRLKFDPPQALEACSKSLVETSTLHGNWNFVNLVTRKCKRLAKDEPIDQETFARAIAMAISTR